MNVQKKKRKGSILLKFLSVLIGFFVWYLFVNTKSEVRTVPVVVSFHNISRGKKIETPEYVMASFNGTRRMLDLFKESDRVIHIDASILKDGKNRVLLSEHNLFLPEAVTLLNYVPSSILVYIHDT